MKNLLLPGKSKSSSFNFCRSNDLPDILADWQSCRRENLTITVSLFFTDARAGFNMIRKNTATGFEENA